MKGVILAGGKATRLRPLTWVTNKHLLPVYNKPMIYYPLEALAGAGIKDVLIITNPDHAGHFINLLRSGSDFGLKITYEIQDSAGGIPHAIALSEGFSGGKKLLVLLGDNIFKHNLKKAVSDFESQVAGAKVFAKRMATESRQYGVIELNESGKVVSIEEKPASPKSDLAQTGIYMYDNMVFETIRKLKPSARGELEVSELNQIYVDEGTMTCEIMEDWWVDAGTSFDELLRANAIVASEMKKLQLTEGVKK
ncbi:MAG: Glucose-1-phosphate thymidylyltransferase [Candidatus Gottesmanbacteria bacterium GW2011_GWC2_39_8]|uniref:glucose-1-phosphate thymidylyltransferase n=1 Tax=Candidatus Gottesmanbacteria bacterium GW2011_GWC2_39_8 TaxID=1618450 RepID=A0A0G0QAH0_9BACT|nr:MAG: Glucose-1-phosphate thymidylyltransferase [Candidatus Gottesmanbacteria bacterium GW2011_GWC2_39_8]